MHSARFLACTLVLIALAALCSVSPLPAVDARAVDELRVLVLHSYAPDFSWTRDLRAGILSVLDTPEVRACYRVEHLDAKHHDTPVCRARPVTGRSEPGRELSNWPR